MIETPRADCEICYAANEAQRPAGGWHSDPTATLTIPPHRCLYWYCGAETKTGTGCRQSAPPGRRCPHHGGKPYGGFDAWRRAQRPNHDPRRAFQPLTAPEILGWTRHQILELRAAAEALAETAGG
jgi:hypothetical protein